MTRALFPILDLADGMLSSVFPPAARISVSGVVAGCLVMGLYWLLSPQKAIKRRKRALAESMTAALADDIEFKQVLAISLRNLRQSTEILGLVLLPSLLSAAPIIILALWMNARFHEQRFMEWGPSWLGSWEVLFFFWMSVAALAFKAVFKID